MTNIGFKSSQLMRGEIGKLVTDIKSRIDAFGYTMVPFSNEAHAGIPFGWVTVGMTKIGLPEFYTSGIAPYSETTADLNKRLKTLYLANRDNGFVIPNHKLCSDINAATLESMGDEPAIFQYRPVDRIRMLYGQSLALRYWLEDEGLTEIMSGIQIVHRDTSGNFPMVSTSDQLLLDYTPFGIKRKEIYHASATV